jgi:hypothetical protein
MAAGKRKTFIYAQGKPTRVIVLKRLMFIVLIALLAFGCLDQASSQDRGIVSNSGSGVSAPASAPVLGESSVKSAQTQYVTKEGTISIKVNEGALETKFQDLKTQLKSQGADTGNIVYSEYGDRKQYTVTVKVAPNKFESMMSALQGIGEVKDMSVSLEDVTRQYIDLDTRIKNSETELVRLRELYNQSGKIEDMLNVEREITRVETDLEMFKQSKQDLTSRIDRSTINISLYEEKPATQQLTLSIENLGGMFFGAMAVAISVVVVVVGFLLPVALVVGVLWFAYKALRGKKGSRPRQPEHSRIPPPQ